MLWEVGRWFPGQPEAQSKNPKGFSMFPKDLQSIYPIGNTSQTYIVWTTHSGKNPRPARQVYSALGVRAPQCQAQGGGFTPGSLSLHPHR